MREKFLFGEAGYFLEQLMAELPFDDRAGSKDLSCPLGKLVNPGHDHLLDGGGDGDGLDVLGERDFSVPALDNL